MSERFPDTKLLSLYIGDIRVGKRNAPTSLDPEQGHQRHNQSGGSFIEQLRD